MESGGGRVEEEARGVLWDWVLGVAARSTADLEYPADVFVGGHVSGAVALAVPHVHARPRLHQQLHHVQVTTLRRRDQRRLVMMTPQDPGWIRLSDLDG
jgi:hypothetical protein